MLRTTQLTAKFGSIEGFSESKFSHREDNYTFGEEVSPFPMQSKKSSLLHIHESTPKKTSISKVYTFNNLSSSRDKNIEKYFHSYPSFQQTETTLQRNQSKYKEFQR